MGAPGNAFLCRRGHLYHWIDDDLYWEDADFGYESARKNGCPCGEKASVVLCHYGDINDCQGPNERLAYQGEETLRWREQVPEASDRDGHPIVAFRDVEMTLPVYDVAKLNFPVPIREG